MGISIKDTGNKIKKMVRERKYSIMDKNMSGSIEMIRNKVMVHIILTMEIYIKESGN